MTGKMEGFHSINSNPLDNPFCNRMASVPGSICSQCYSRRMLGASRKHCGIPWSENNRILSGSVIPEEHIPDLSRLQCNGAFRFSSHGEIINENHLVNLLNIARKNPDITFGLWTKRFDGRNIDEIPDNVVLVASTRLTNIAFPVVPMGLRYLASTQSVCRKHGVRSTVTGVSECMICYHKGTG